MAHAGRGTRLMMPIAWTGCALLVWGQATGQLLFVVPFALLLELAPWLPRHFEFERVQFERCADGSSVAFAALALYQFNVHALYGIYAILALMPWCLLPLTVMQTLSTQRATPLAALVYSLRRAGSTAQIDLRLALGLAALVGASAGELPREHYAIASAVLLVWLLWARRPHRQRQARWLALAGVAAALAIGLQSAYLWLHLLAGDVVQDWFREMNLSPADAERASTAIGSLRQLKLSDRIFLRVRTPAPLRERLLLSEASYGEFRYGAWSNARSAPITVDAESGARRWQLAPATRAGTTYDIALTRQREIGIVPLPPGAALLDARQILDVRRMPGDALSVEAPQGLLQYAVTTGAPGTARAPTAVDVTVPEEYRALLTRQAAEIGLDRAAQRSPQAALDRLQTHFARHFRYSLVQANVLPWRTPLAEFLTRTRRGHCEYFASATVLLLRAAGIPARYVVGYAVDEYSGLEGAWVARARDAHAWAIAWVDGAWQVVDTTPSSWAALEDAEAPAWQAWFDAASWLAHQWRRLQAGDAPGLRQGLVGVAAMLAVWLLWRQRRRLRASVAVPEAGVVTSFDPASPLAALLQRLARRGRRPAPGETLARFLRRQLPPAQGPARLETLIALHYLARFGERALSPAERRELEDCVQAYLQAL